MFKTSVNNWSAGRLLSPVLYHDVHVVPLCLYSERCQEIFGFEIIRSFLQGYSRFITIKFDFNKCLFSSTTNLIHL